MKVLEIQAKLIKAKELSSAGNHSEAHFLYEKLTRICPKDPMVWLEYGATAASLQKIEVAEEAFAKVEKLHDNRADILQLLGLQYLQARYPERARECFLKAITLAPRDINLRINLALEYEKNRQFDEARSEIEECLKIAPGDEQGRYCLAFLDAKSGRLNEAECQLRDLIALKPKHEYVRYAAHYQLAEILDKTQRYDEAIECLGEAKNIIRELVPEKILKDQQKNYDLLAEQRLKVLSSLRKEILVKWQSAFSKQKLDLVPMAILGGHPRSGTTLLEQILDAHPDVAAIDEPKILSSALIHPFSVTADYPETVLNVMRRRYVNMLQRNAGCVTARKFLLEKNPSLTAELPVMLRLFPEILVIIALRDPRDVILSCYFQNIPLNIINANFLSFERLVKHYSDLMQVWIQIREWTGLHWIETRYEDTVADMEKEGNRVTSFMGLKWCDGQKNFFETSERKRLYSPTYNDVIKPVYSRAVGRWRSYEKYLAPIIPHLKPYCQALGYS